MPAALFYRHSLIFLCFFVSSYFVFVLFYNPFRSVDTPWRDNLLPHFGSHRPSSLPLLPPLGEDADSSPNQGGTHVPSPLHDDYDYEANVAPPSFADGISSAVNLQPSPPSSSMMYPPFQPAASSATSHTATLELPASSYSQVPTQAPEPPQTPFAKHCSDLPGADDVMIAMKTGESELKDKLPVHFNTTFTCAKHFAIFSDVDREINGHHVKDVLAGIPYEIRHEKYEFDFYNRLHESFQDGADDFEPLKNGAAEKEDNPAWILDKWKFLPIIEQAYEHKPDAKWYLFIEADATVVWWNLLGWLSKLDHTQPLYLGGQAWIGETEFGHGGAGYILSHAAVTQLVSALKSDPRRYERVAQECCGDFVVAVALRELLGLKLLTSWPSIQGETPTTLDYSADHWCHPAITYHHMNESQIAQVWALEQAWEAAHAHMGPLAAPLMHRDMFDALVWPHVGAERDNWDNLSTDVELRPDSEDVDDFLQGAFASAEACRDACVRTANCAQWSWAPDACGLQFAPRLGDATAAQRPLGEGMRSGWLTERIEEVRRQKDGCEPVWITERSEE